MRYYRNSEFWLILILLLITISFSIVSYYYWYRLTFFVGSFLFSHWLSLIGIVFIAIFNPIHYILKRTRPRNLKLLLRIHVFGNLFSFLLVSLHFAQHLGRLAGFIQRLGTGVVSFFVLSIIVATGILQRFRITRKLERHTKFLHTYIVIFFYLIIFIHMLQGFNII